MNRANALLLGSALFLAAPAGSQSEGVAAEQSIKAANLYKFADYVEGSVGVRICEHYRGE